MTRDIGINVKPLKNEPDKTDKKNPFNGTLSVPVSYTHLTLPTKA